MLIRNWLLYRVQWHTYLFKPRYVSYIGSRKNGLGKSTCVLNLQYSLKDVMDLMGCELVSVYSDHQNSKDLLITTAHN